MSLYIFIPSSTREAATHLRNGFQLPHTNLDKREFVRVWNSIAYLFPGLHPDGFDEVDSGWPRVLKKFATEAWRRAESGELNGEELYPSDAQWSGLYDRMELPTEDETARRLDLAAATSGVE